MEEKQILYVDFSTLRKSYIEVKNFLEKKFEEKGFELKFKKKEYWNLVIENNQNFCLWF